MIGRHRLVGTLAAAVILAQPFVALAQDEEPAIGGMAPAAEPQAAKQAQPAKAPSVGTTIIGEQESPIGLYIMPWRESRAEKDMDRPARLLQEKLLPVDEDVFVRQIEYYNALSDALKRKGVVTPGGR